MEPAARIKEESVLPENVTKIIKALTENLGKSSTGGNVQAAATIARKMSEAILEDCGCSDNCGSLSNQI
jgi:hypothetical protein